MIGKTISHYRIIEQIGTGGMGIVYKAEDTTLKRIVALKFLPQDLTRDAEAKKRFVHEAQAASSLEHPNICNIHEINETENGQTYIVMACYEGKTLKQLVQDGPLEVDESIRIITQVAKGLSKAHRKGIIHRDIKPANVIIDEDGTAKILDFGLAKLSGRTLLTKTGTTMGTINYMSPEQARGDIIDQRTDIWSLGVVFYEMLTGQLLFKGEYDQAVIYSILNEEPESFSTVDVEIPDDLELIIKKLLSKVPQERYQQMDKLIDDLQKYEKCNEITTPLLKRSKMWFKWTAISSMVLALVLAYLFLIEPMFEDEAEPVPIVVISFKNQTGDKSYDYLQDAIPNLLITSLEQSKNFQVVTWERIYDLLRQLGKDDVGLIDKNLGFEICQMEGVEAIVLGTFVKAGNVFTTDVKVLDIHSKEILKSAKATGDGVSSILKNQIDDLSREISSGVLSPEQRIEKTQVNISEMTTSSMEAYNYFLRGKEYVEHFNYPDARRLLERAIQIDSTFAMAYLYLTDIYGNIADYKKRNAAFEKAMMYSVKSPQKERLTIEARYALIIEQNLDKSISIYESLLEKYPLDKHGRSNLATLYQRYKFQDSRALEEYKYLIKLYPLNGSFHNQIGYLYAKLHDFEKAIYHIRQYISLQPGEANPLDSMGEIFLRKGEIDSAIYYFKEAQTIQPDFTADWRIAYCYALKQDYDKAMNWNERFKIRCPNLPFSYYFIKGFYQHLQGNSRAALKNIDHASQIIDSLQIGYIYQKFANGRLQAWIKYDLGEFINGRKTLEKTIKPFINSNSDFVPWYKLYFSLYTGLIHLKEGKIDSARHNFMNMQNQLPKAKKAVKMAQYYFDHYAAEIAFSSDSLDKAIGLKIKSGFYYYPRMEIPTAFLHNLPFKDDLLPRLYQAKGDIEQAIREYERLTTIDHSGNDRDRRFIPNIFNYRLAKLYDSQGHKEKAIEKYEHFLNIWKEADPDIPELNDAKKRLEKLK